MAEELTGDLELLVDLDRLGDLDPAIGSVHRRIIEFAQCGMPRAGVVPAVRALIRDLIQPLDDLDRPARLQLAQQYPERRAHDPAADQQHVDGAFGGGTSHIDREHRRTARDQCRADHAASGNAGFCCVGKIVVLWAVPERHAVAILQIFACRIDKKRWARGYTPVSEDGATVTRSTVRNRRRPPGHARTRVERPLPKLWFLDQLHS